VALPDFVYIGTARAGSTWLFEALRQHPEIYVPPAKDIYFFDRYYTKGLAWYEGFFKDIGDARIAGELSHDYYYSEAAADRIKADVPEVKLICCLREPVDKLLSGYAYNQTMNVDASVSLEDYARDPKIQKEFHYYEHLRTYFERFPAEQMLVVFYEDLKNDPVKYIQSIYDFLGVDIHVVPEAANATINAARTARSQGLALFTYRIAQVFRGLGLANFVGRVKQSAMLNKMLYQSAEREDVSMNSLPADVVEQLREHHGKLAALLGKPLPASWYKG